MNVCKECKKPISIDEIALYRKLIYRETDEHECLCISCLSARLKVSKTALEDKIEHFKKIGCTLFN